MAELKAAKKVESILHFRDDNELLWYLAGVFDGEGCVYAGITKSGRTHACCKVAMTDLATIELFQNRFPGLVLKERPRSERYSALYRWAITGRAAIPFLEVMSVRCGIKSAATKLMLEYVNRIKDGVRLTQQEKRERVELLVGIRSTITRTNAKSIPTENIEAYLNLEPKGCPKPVIDGVGNRYASRTDAAMYHDIIPQCISSAITHGSTCCGTTWHEAE